MSKKSFTTQLMSILALLPLLVVSCTHTGDDGIYLELTDVRWLRSHKRRTSMKRTTRRAASFQDTSDDNLPENRR